MDKWFENKNEKYKKIYHDEDLENYKPEITKIPFRYYLKKYWYLVVIIILLILYFLK